MSRWPYETGAPLPAPKALLFDLDGTLYRGDEPVPGADKLITDCEARGIPCWYVTNNSTRTPAQVAEHLNKMGIRAQPHQIVTSAEAAASYAKSRYPGARACVVGEYGLQVAMREAGFGAAGPGESGIDLVVQGIDRTLTYDRLKEAAGHLIGGAAYLLTNPDRQLPVAGGVLPGAGSIAAALQAASGTEPIVIGKPSTILMSFALERAGVSAEDAWVVGDNPLTDIAAGVAAGCPTALVLTGLCADNDWEERCAKAGVTPDLVCPGPAELGGYLERG